MNMRVVLKVPGAEVRFGVFVCDLGFDEMVKVQLLGEVDHKGRRKIFGEQQKHYYLAHGSHVTPDTEI